jgi:hypothetical protein
VKNEEVLGLCTEVFNDLFPQNSESRYKGKIEKRFSTDKTYPIIKEMAAQLETSKTLDNESVLCDEVFAEYLLTVRKMVNPEYFKRLILFVFLYWENINSLKRQDGNDGDYTSKHNAEDAPDLSNEFITEFLQHVSDPIDFTKEEAIKLTQNFCQWMYDSNYTCSKLTLISN